MSAPSEQEWTPEKILRYFSIVNPPLRAHVERLAQDINAALAAKQKERDYFHGEVHQLARQLAAERQRAEKESDSLDEQWQAVVNKQAEQLLSALAAIEKKNAKLMELIQFHVSGDPCHVLETVALQPDLSALDKHDAELWRMLIDGKPRAICAKCGYPELIGSDDCRNCCTNFAERIEFGDQHDAEVRKPLVDLLREAQHKLNPDLTKRIADALAKVKETK